MSHKLTSINSFISKQAERVLKESSLLARELHQDNVGEMQAEYVHICSTIIANILFSVWCSIKVMGGRQHANEFIDAMAQKVKDQINQKVGVDNGEGK